MSYLSDVLAYPTFAHYRLGDASGDLADASGNGRTAVASGPGAAIATFGVPGAIGGDADTAINIAGARYWYTGGGAQVTRTLIVWVKTTALSGVFAGTYYPTSSYFDLRLNTEGKPLANVNTYSIVGPEPINDGQWHMLAMTFYLGLVTLYVDGVSVGAADDGASIQSASDRIHIGGTVSGPNADLDEVSFLTTALTGPQIAALYASAATNDRFANAIDITAHVAAGTYTSPAISQANATTETDEAASPWDRSLWWKYTAPAGGATLDLDTELGPSAETGLFVYTGTAISNLVQIAQDDDGGSVGGTSKLTAVQINAGVTIYIKVASYTGYASGDVVLRATRTGGFAFGDNFVDAEEVILAADGATYTSASVSNASATMEVGEPQPTAYVSGKTLWWKYTPATSGTATFDLSLGAGDPEMAVYTGSSVDALTKIASDSDSGAGNTSKITDLAVTGGTTYYIQVASWQGATTTYQLQVTGPATASGPSPQVVAIGRASRSSTARALTTLQSQVVALGRASRSASARALTAAQAGGSTVPWIGAGLAGTEAGRWWTGFPVGGPTPQFKLLGRASAPRAAQPLTVLQGPAPRSIAIGRVSVARTARALTRVRMLTRSLGRATRSSTARPLTAVTTANVPNAFINPQHVVIATNGGTYLSPAIPNTTATLEAGEPVHPGFSLDRSLWWRYAPASSGTATFDLSLGTGATTPVTVYTGGSLASLTEVGFNSYGGANNQGLISLPVVAGQLYWIQVASIFGDTGVYQPQVTGPATLPAGITPIGRASRPSIAREIPAPLDYYPAEVLRNDPAIYWRFEEGPDALDYSGNGRHGIFGNWEGSSGELGQTQLVPGAIGQGQRFDDCEVYYSDPDTYSLTVDFSLEMWFNGYSYPLANLGTTLMVGVGFGQKGIGFRTTSGVTYIYGTWGSSTTRQNMVPAAPLNDGNWHHLVLTRGGGSVRFYVDGELAYSEDGAASFTPNSSGWMAAGSFSPEVGDPPSPAFDEMAYYDYALAPSRVERHYDSAIQLGNPPLHATVPLGRVTAPRLAQPLTPVFPQAAAIGRAARSSSARTLTPLQGAAPGTPQFVPIGRATRTATARPLSQIASQIVQIGRAVRQGTARALTYATGVLYADSFSRPAPVGTPDVGGPYAYPGSISANFTIVDGALRAATNSTTYITTTVGSEIDATFTIKTVGQNGAFLFRYAAFGQHWSVRWVVGQGLSLYCQHTSSVAAQVGGTIALGVGDVVRVVARGKIIHVHLNGRLVLQAEDVLPSQGTAVGFRFINDQVSLIEDISVRNLLPLVHEDMDSLDLELALILSEGDHDAFIYKGRDSRVADEGLMA